MHSARTQRTYAMILALAHKGLDIVPVLTYRGGVDYAMLLQVYVQELTNRRNYAMLLCSPKWCCIMFPISPIGACDVSLYSPTGGVE